MERAGHILLPLCGALLFACGGAEKEPSSTATEPAEAKLFTLLPPAHTGIRFENRVPENDQMNILVHKYHYNGGGVSVGDLDGDGLPELFFTGNAVANRLYRNLGGMRFEDVTAIAGITNSNRWSTGTVMVDIDGDGDLDIYVCNGGLHGPDDRRNELWINNGDATFTESAAAFGLDDPGHSTHAVFFDMDGDGDLDCFVLNHGVGGIIPLPMIETLRRTPDPWTGDRLYRNDGGRFTDVSAGSGINRSVLGMGLGVAATDVNDDGLPDLYICNDFFERDQLLINNGNGTFTDHIMAAMRHISHFSMGVDAADINNDGQPDIMVADMVAEDNYRRKANMSGMDPERFHRSVSIGLHHQYMVNTLQLNRGTVPPSATAGDASGTVPPVAFSEVARLAGVSRTDWSWAPLLADLDLDGHLDLYVTNGLRKDVRNTDFSRREERAKQQAATTTDPAQHLSLLNDLLAHIPSTPIVNAAFRNNGDLTFTHMEEGWGLQHPGFSNGAAYADLDGDGDLDLVVSNIDAPPFVYENHAVQQQRGNFLTVVLHGPGANTFGIGARVELHAAGTLLMRENQPSRGFQSGVEPILHFGTGTHTKLDSVRVRWPDGARQVLRDVPAGRKLHLYHAHALKRWPAPDPPPTLLSDITRTHGPQHMHQENDFDDFAVQVLLPHRMSQLGPALAVGDVDGDGLDDIHVGGAAGMPGALYRQTAKGTFVRMPQPALDAHAAHEDVASLLADLNGDGHADLYVVSGGYEFDAASPLLQDRLYLNDGKGRFIHAPDALPAFPVSGGCVVAADLDGDGHTDLFVGGRQVPGRYPEAPTSHVLRNDGTGRFTDATAAMAPELQQPGMVTAALATDLDGDGRTDLVVVGEWMPVMLMHNSGGVLRNTARDLLPQPGNGWWSAVAAGDLNGDGVPDLVLGNLGLNYSYKASPQEPFQVYSGDLDGNGTHDIVLVYHQQGERYPVRGRECSAQQLPAIKERFPTYDQFARSSFADIYPHHELAAATLHEAHTFASTMLLSNGMGGYTAVPLPVEAQFSSVNGIVLHDVDGDGHLDVLLAGNLWQSEVETMRNDASLGLLLLGDGSGTLTPLPMQRSGFFAHGDVKTMQRIRLADGRTAVVLANNQGPVQVFGINTITGSTRR